MDSESHSKNNHTVPEEKLASGTLDAYDKRKERSLSFFNFSVFKRTTSDCSEAKEKAIRATQKKKAQKKDTGTRSKLFSAGKTRQLRRSRSLTEVNGCVSQLLYSISRPFAIIALCKDSYYRRKETFCGSSNVRNFNFCYGSLQSVILCNVFLQDTFYISSLLCWTDGYSICHLECKLVEIRG